MLHRKRLKIELEPLQTKLEHWKTAVPERAQRFHLTALELSSSIQAHLSVWKFFINEAKLTMLKESLLTLDNIADDLIALIKKTILLENEIKQIQTLAADTKSNFLKRWIPDQTDNWLIKCKRIGVECERDNDLAEDKRKLKEIQNTVRDSREAIALLTQAEMFVDLLQTDFPTDIAPLVADLPRLQQRLEDAGISELWLTEIKDLLEPLQKIENAVPPPVIDSLAQAFPRLDGWSRQLDNYQKTEIDQLRRRYLQLKSEWRKAEAVSEADMLDEQVTGLLRQITEQARHLRAEKIKTFKQQLTQFKKATGPQDEFDAQLQHLADNDKNIDQHQAHKAWWQDFNTLSDRFNGFVQNHLLDLQESLEEQFDKTAEKLYALKATPLSDENKHKLAQFEQKLDVYKNPDELSLSGILVGLNNIEQLEQDIASLTAETATETASLTQAQQDFTAKNAYHQQLAEQYNIQLEDLTLQISTLTKPDAAQRDHSLTTTLNAQKTLETQLQQQEDLLKTELGTQFSAKLQILADLQETLDDITAGEHQMLALPAKPTSADDLAAFAEVYAKLLEIESRLNNSVEETINSLEREKAFLTRNLEQLKTQNILEGYDLAQLEYNLDYLKHPADQADSTQCLEHLINQVTTAQQFLNQFEQDKTHFFELREQARTQLRQFKAEQLDQNIRGVWHRHTLAFDIIHRIETLIQGIPDEPADLEQAHQQLHTAQVLLNRVVIQAKRMEADKLRQAVAKLDLAQSSALQTQWQKLKPKVQPDALPTLRTRQRVYKLLQELG